MNLFRSSHQQIFLLMQLLLQLSLSLFGRINLLFFLLVKFLLLLETLLYSHPQLILILSLLITYIVSLRSLQIISHILS